MTVDVQERNIVLPTSPSAPRRRAADLKKVRARAPLRIGLAGGGTDLPSYFNEFGGNVLNCTISLYAYAVIEERPDWHLSFLAHDLDATDEMMPAPSLPTHEGLMLHRGVYNRIVREFNDGRPLSINVYTSVDAPPGSGLGSSSALVVALVRAYAELLNLPLGDYDVARLAYEIERHDLGQQGGKQDQYAAAFGGCNFMEFLENDRVIVNPLRLHESHWLEIESSLVLCHTGRSRVSSEIIKQQSSSINGDDPGRLEAMHQIKREAIEMKVEMLRGNIPGMAQVLGRSWEAKKRSADVVSNAGIDELYELAMNNGAMAGKISGAGGGGFFMIMVPPEHRPRLARKLAERGLTVLACQFTAGGAQAWTVGG